MRKSTIACSFMAAAMLIAGSADVMAAYAESPAKVISKVAPAGPYMQGTFSLDNGGQVQISVKAPVIDENGIGLTAGTMTMTVTRDCPALGEYTKTVKSWINVQPGEDLTFVDTKDVVLGYTYTYHAYATMNGERSVDYLLTVTAGFRPERCTELDVYTDNGRTPVTITAVCPTELEGGVPFPEGVELTYVIIRRDEYMSGLGMQEIGRVTKVRPGGVIMFEDNDPELKEGVTYTYSVAAGCTYGEGQTVFTNITIGEGVPNNVTNLKADLQPDGTAIVSWVAPTSGKNNTWIDTEGLRYDIYRYYSEFDIRLLAEDYETEDCTYIDSFEDLDVAGRFAYQVIPVNEKGAAEPGLEDISNFIVAGPISKLPFYEAFNKRDTGLLTPSHAWTNTKKQGNITFGISNGFDYNAGSKYSPDYRYLSGFYHEGERYAQDEVLDGMAAMQFPILGVGNQTCESFLVSDKINIANTKDPVLRFKYFTVPNNDSTLRCYIDDADDKNIGGEFYYLMDNKLSQPAWKEAEMDLNPYKSYGTIKIRFQGKCEKQSEVSGPVAVDEVCVYDLAPVKNIRLLTHADTGVHTIFWDGSAAHKYDSATYNVTLDGVFLGTTTENLMQCPQLVEGRKYEVKIVARYARGESDATVVQAYLNNSSVDAIGGNDVIDIEYYSFQGIRIVPEDGETVVAKIKYADGTNRSIKTVYKK